MQPTDFYSAITEHIIYLEVGSASSYKYNTGLWQDNRPVSADCCVTAVSRQRMSES